MADAQLEPGRLAAGQPSHLADKGHHLQGRRERPVIGRRNAILAHGNTADPGNLFRDLGRRQHAAMTGLGALADLELDHLDLIVAGDARELLRIEGAVAVAAAEIAGAYLPDDIAAILAVIGADTALAGVVREATLPGPRIQRTHRIGAKRTETHRRNIEDRRRIRPGAIGSADGDAEFLLGMRLRRHRMVHPLITLAVDVFLGAEGPLVEHHLGALIDHRAGVAGKRHAVLLALEEILPHFGPDLFEQKTDVRRDRIVTQNGVALLRQVAKAEERQRAEEDDRDQHDFPYLLVMVENPDAEQQCRDDGADRQHDEAWRERKQQRFHQSPSARLLLSGGSLVQPAE